MNNNAILSSDVLDILFDKRNKKYGAYVLRKFYPERVKTSLVIMLGSVVLLSAFTFLPESKSIIVSSYADDTLTVRQIDLPKDIKKPKEAFIPQSKKMPTQQLTSTYETVKDNNPSTVFHNIENMAIGTSTDTSGMSFGPTDPFPATPIVAGNILTAASMPEPVVSTPVENPDVQASFPGGNAALISFLERNLHATEDINEMVEVKIKFVVGFDGNLQSFDIVQDGGESFNNEVVRVLKKMPKWNPGKKGGRNVPVYYCLPVKFAPTE